MNFARLFLLIAIVGFMVQLFLPWWSLAVVSFMFALWLARKADAAFWAGFFGIGTGWLFLSGFYHVQNSGLLSAKVATLFTLPHAALLIFVTAIIGALTGGLAAISGFYFQSLFK